MTRGGSSDEEDRRSRDPRLAGPGCLCPGGGAEVHAGIAAGLASLPAHNVGYNASGVLVSASLTAEEHHRYSGTLEVKHADARGMDGGPGTR
jgi:hypothetical protein